MYGTYAAVLRNGRVEWVGDPPPGLLPGQPARVQITLLDSPRAAGSGAIIAAILEQMAARGGLESIPDPLIWERERRRDRPLPGRESDE